jgi:recombination protein RecR
MELYSGYVNRLVSELAALPGIGDKSAQRLAFHMINMPPEKVKRLADTMIEARSRVKYCSCCYTLTDTETCPVCSNPARDHATIMVVEDTRDMSAYEKTQKYGGVYHVLHGAIAPMLGVGPNDIKIKELVERCSDEANPVSEVILATNSSIEGETTAMYISKLIKPLGVKVTRIASGVPVGGDLEYIDEITLTRALDGRVEV